MPGSLVIVSFAAVAPSVLAVAVWLHLRTWVACFLGGGELGRGRERCWYSHSFPLVIARVFELYTLRNAFSSSRISTNAGSREVRWGE